MYIQTDNGYRTQTQLGWLGDDNTTLENLGFSNPQVQQIVSSFKSGALSPSGYQAIMSGQVGPAQLDDFLAANMNVGQVTRSGGNVVAISDVNAELSPNPAPTVAAPFDLATWLGMSTTIGGITVPNFVVIGVPAVLFWMAGHHKGRHH